MRWVPDRPFSLRRWADRFDRWGPDLVNVFSDGTYHRVTAAGGYRARQLPGGAIELDGEGAADAVEADFRTRAAEGLPWEPVLALAERDRRVSRLVSKHAGFRPVITPDPWEAATGLVLAQQVNLAWAFETKARFVRAFGVPHASGQTTVWAFPTPERIAVVTPDELRDLQLTRRKAEFIVGLAGATQDGAFAPVPALGTEAAITHLMALRGVGRWTADQLLARCWARPQVAAAGDLGVRKAVSFHWHASDRLLAESVVRDTTTGWGSAANLLSQLLLEEL